MLTGILTQRRKQWQKLSCKGNVLGKYLLKDVLALM